MHKYFNNCINKKMTSMQHNMDAKQNKMFSPWRYTIDNMVIIKAMQMDEKKSKYNSKKTCKLWSKQLK